MEECIPEVERVTRDAFNWFGPPVIVANVFSNEESNRIAELVLCKLKERTDLVVVDCGSAPVDGFHPTLKMPSGDAFIASLDAGEARYLRDWHLSLEMDETFYDVPQCFLPDWMDLFMRMDRKDDFRFVYFGGVGSWTGLHTDVLATHSWSVNVRGRKEWVFWRPGIIDDPDGTYSVDKCYWTHPEEFPRPSFHCLQSNRKYTAILVFLWKFIPLCSR